MTRKYTFREEDIGSGYRYLVPSRSTGRPQFGSPGPVDAALLFDTPRLAAHAFAQRTAEYGVSRHAELVAVYITPGEARREVVELTGTVDFDGLKFAVGMPFFGGPYRHSSRPGAPPYALCHGGAPYTAGGVEKAVLFDSVGSAVSSGSWKAWGGPFIVGVREVPADPTYTVTPLA